MAMIPSWVVLRRIIPVFPDDQKVQELEIMGRAEKEPIAGGDDDPVASSVLRVVTLDAHLVDPPEISTLSLRARWGELEREIGATVLSVHENLIVIDLQAILASDQPRYILVHDATKNSLSLVPHVDISSYTLANKLAANRLPEVAGLFYFPCIPVALRLDDGSYALVDLGFRREIGIDPEVLPLEGTLYQWSSTRPGKWDSMKARFHQQMTPPCKQWIDHSFETDVSFAFQGKVFWVDLRLGAVVCDLAAAAANEVKLSFVHLPPECKWPAPDYTLRFVPTDLRTMGRVGDSIRFVSLSLANGDDYPNEGDQFPPPCMIVVKTWTLAWHHRWWKRDHDMTLALPRLWKSEAFMKERLPRCELKRPVLSANEDGIVYFLLADYYRDRWGCMLARGEFLISVDMRRKTLISCSHLPLSSGLYMPNAGPSRPQPGEGFRPEDPHICGAMFPSYDSIEAKSSTTEEASPVLITQWSKLKADH